MSRPKGSRNKYHTSDGEARSNSIDSAVLRLYIERIESVNAEIADLTGDRREIYAEVKGAGYDTATVRAIVKRRGMSPDKRHNMEALMNEYTAALGDFINTPLGMAGASQIGSEVRV